MSLWLIRFQASWVSIWDGISIFFSLWKGNHEYPPIPEREVWSIWRWMVGFILVFGRKIWVVFFESINLNLFLFFIQIQKKLAVFVKHSSFEVVLTKFPQFYHQNFFLRVCSNIWKDFRIVGKYTDQTDPLGIVGNVDGSFSAFIKGSDLKVIKIKPWRGMEETILSVQFPFPIRMIPTNFLWKNRKRQSKWMKKENLRRNLWRYRFSWTLQYLLSHPWKSKKTRWSFH